MLRTGRLVVGYGILMIGACFDFEPGEGFKDLSEVAGVFFDPEADDSAP